MDRLQEVRDTCERAQQLLDARSTPEAVLAFLTDAGERIAGEGSAVSILALDQAGLLRNAASPRLPADYLAAIDGIRPDANLGTCAAAAATGKVVLTPSFLADGKWDELRHLPMAIGYAGAWSMPIKSRRSGRVLGTFGTYYREIREPSTDDIAAVALLAQAAAVALEPAAH